MRAIAVIVFLALVAVAIVKAARDDAPIDYAHDVTLSKGRTVGFFLSMGGPSPPSLVYHYIPRREASGMPASCDVNYYAEISPSGTIMCSWSDTMLYPYIEPVCGSDERFVEITRQGPAVCATRAL